VNEIEFLRAYNQVRQGWGLGTLRQTLGRLKDCGTFLSWCESESIDPELYTRARFDAISGGRGIQVAALRSEKFVGKFKVWGVQRQAAQRKAENEHELPVTGSTTVRKAYLEALRRVRVYEREECLYDFETQHDPESPTCGRCELKERCSARG